MNISPKPIYLNNKELLKEIHSSKKSFCWFEQPEYGDYDGIVTNLDEITTEFIDRIIHKKANPKGKVAPVFCGPEDLVFRVMTYEHIPLDPDRKRKARNTEQSYTRTNFPPFKHYVLRDGAPVEVGRSHWRGTPDDGEFSVEQGRMTNTLARMFMLIVERYSRRGNWRGYSYVDEMRSLALMQLSQVALQFDESKGDNPFAFFTTVIKNSFTRHLNVERRNQNIRDELLIYSGAMPSNTRQIEHELEQRFQGAPPVEKKRPGRKPGVKSAPKIKED